jgi:formylmethanofuran dehydrogenase subunit E
MPDLQKLLEESAAHHRGHLCPRQVLGVRMGLYAAELFGLSLPQGDKRLFAFVETDGCLTDGIAVATGCWWGRRTMRLIDYGKTAVTFVDTQIERAVRISPAPAARTRCEVYASNAPDRWHAQLDAYQTMPTAELLDAHEVVLTISLQAILSQPGLRVVCAQCGEDILNERFIRQGDQFLCLACGEGAYYTIRWEAIRAAALNSHEDCR